MIAEYEARIAKFKAERDIWQESSGQNYVRAQAAEDREQKLERRIEELEAVIFEAPHHEDCSSLIWTSDTPRSPCDCWKSNALEGER